MAPHGLVQRRGIDQPAAQCGVDHDDRLLERDRPGDVEHRTHRCGDRYPTGHEDLVRVERRAVDVHGGAATATRAAATAGDVHPVERHAPQRQPVHHRGRDVADDGVPRQVRERRADAYEMPGGVAARIRAGQVRAAADGAEGAGAAGPPNLGVGVPGDVQLTAQVKIHDLERAGWAAAGSRGVSGLWTTRRDVDNPGGGRR